MRVLRYLLFYSLSSRPSRIGARGAWIEDRGGNNSPLYLTTCQLWEGAHPYSLWSLWSYLLLTASADEMVST